jgi:hypothetical protein
MKQLLKRMVKSVPPIRGLTKERDAIRKERDEYCKFVPPGHFYSPIPSIPEILQVEGRIWGELPLSIPGIDLNTDGQLDLVEEFATYYQELPFKDEKSDGLRYYFKNGSYSYSDAIFLYCMIRHARPRKFIEVGSGHSSCVTLDTNELFFNHQISCSFVEPYPALLNSLIKESDRASIKVYESRLQDMPLEVFRALKANDILFIDSTHVSKIHSDVNFVIHEILPLLATGVYIHFHDVFYPFEYPKEWLLEGRAWNEQYLLRAFLEFNPQFKIVFFNTYLESIYRDKLEKRMPLIFKNTGGSLWIQRV